MEFRLLSYMGKDGAPRSGLLVGDDRVVDIATALGGKKIPPGCNAASTLSILEHWDSLLPMLRELAETGASPASAVVGPLSDCRLAAPILYPPAICCAAANYVDHGREMGDKRLPDKSTARPYFFNKLPRHTVVGPDASIRIPCPGAKVDWEAEIGVVMGRPCRSVTAADAMKYVAGLVVLNDVSDRARNFRKDWDFKFDWLGGKSFDTSCPMGPWITPMEFISDPHALRIRLWVNDTLMQDASSQDMYFTIPEQIEYLSELVTLQPGDVIATGTPMGVGHARGIYLNPGDTVVVTIENLGTIRNPVIAGY
jgi:2-keto-4-pentenoate hydratase/2-oxohepta-3-ene-1,7-dioic acid hydratase in catechol pathway